MTSYQWYCASSFFRFFLHLVLFLHLVKVCTVVLFFSVCTFCTKGDNNNNNNNNRTYGFTECS